MSVLLKLSHNVLKVMLFATFGNFFVDSHRFRSCKFPLCFIVTTTIAFARAIPVVFCCSTNSMLIVDIRRTKESVRSPKTKPSPTPKASPQRGGQSLSMIAAKEFLLRSGITKSESSEVPQSRYKVVSVTILF